jgi:hypothetical protein
MIAGEIFYYGVNKYFDQIKGYTDKGANAEERVRIFVDRAIEIIKENRDFFKVYVDFLAKESDRPEVQSMITTFYDKYIETLKGIIDEGVQSGAFRDVESEKLARAIYFLSIGVLFARFAMKVKFDLDDQNHFQLSSILESIRKK